ncbi:AAA family ATPase [Nocardia sp. NPDC057227]|uniref:helix-turn-helix transcriptional regulator n=1 Tax=Nocardia sp. NPDC057227 TaxID=3346056 RepID=UPI00363F3D59
MPHEVIRHSELQRITDLIEIDERGTRIVEIVGEPGAGKSFLLSALARRAEAGGLSVLSARCAEHDPDIPCLPLLAALGAMTDPAEPALRLHRSLSAQGRSRHPEHDPQVLEAFRHMLRTSPARTLLLLDDFHLVDPATLALVRALIRSVAGVGLVVIVAHRPRPIPPQVRCFLDDAEPMPGVRVELLPLNADCAARLLRMDEANAAVGELNRAAAGNPLYLLTLAGQRRAAQLELGETSLGSRVLAELAGLDPDQVHVAEAAAVFGEPVDIDTLAFLTRLGTHRSCRATNIVLERDLLRRDPATGAVCFRHPLVRDVVAAHTDHHRRKAIHRRAADLLGRRGAPAVTLAPHLEALDDDALRPEYRHVLYRAALDVLERDPRRAVRWLETVLLRWPEGCDRDHENDSVRIALIRAYLASGRQPQAVKLLREIRSSARPGAAAFGAVAAAALGTPGVLEDPRSPGAGALDPSMTAVSRGAVRFLRGEPLTVGEWGELRRVATRAGSRIERATASALLATQSVWNHDRGTDDGVPACAAELDALTDADCEEHPVCWAALGWAEALSGDPAAAERHFRRGLSAIARSGDVHLRPVMVAGAAYAYQELGRFAEAAELCAEAAPILPELAHSGFRALLTGLEARNSAVMSSTKTASARYESLATRWPRCSRWGRVALLTLADAALLADDAELCAALILRAGGGTELREIPAALLPCCFQALAGASARAFAVPARWVDCATDTAARAPQQQAFVRTAHGHLEHSRGDVGSAAELYGQAAELFAEAGMVGAQTRMLLQAAVVAGQAGQCATARTHLQLARQLARECGAAGLHRAAVEAEAGLARDGARGEPNVALLPLTDRERQVAQLISNTGMRTRELADHLGVSPRTVDAHLTRIYRKLGITSRAALVAVITGRLPPGERYL